MEKEENYKTKDENPEKTESKKKESKENYFSKLNITSNFFITKLCCSC